jgi:hypothetical protein
VRHHPSQLCCMVLYIWWRIVRVNRPY